jgi:hypothetical protein
MRVKAFENLGSGASKQAFTIQENTPGDPYNYTIPDGSDVTKFCIVKYTNTIDWKNESEFPKSFQDFKTQIASNPGYNYDVIYADEIPYGQDATVLKSNKKLYRNHKIQFECTDELRKMRDLGELFAPKLHQIRIDTQSNTGIPFPPEKLDSEFEKIPSGIVTVSYLVERCDDSVIKFVVKNPNKIFEVPEKMIEFIDSYVDTFGELNCDIKSENFCPRIIDGRIVSIRLLDVDPKFCIKGDTPEFKKNAKVFMKYAFMTHSAKWGQKIDDERARIHFGNLGLTQNDVDAMVLFFYTKKYMVYEFNPINMLYHYFVCLHPGNFKVMEMPVGWEKMVDKTGKTYYRNKFTKEVTDDYPLKYEFLSYDKLTKYFKKYSMIEQILDYCNTTNKIVFLSEEGGTSMEEETGVAGPSEQGTTIAAAAEGPSEETEEPSKNGHSNLLTESSKYKKEGGITMTEKEDNVFNFLKGGKRKRKSKKRKNRKRKYTRKA